MLKTRRLQSKGLKRPISPKKRRKSGEITKLKKALWKLLRENAINTYGRTCFTCARESLEGGNCQLGHFITSSTCSTELRYDPRNLRIQCYHCNINLSGNWIAFERNLLRDGQDIAELKARNAATKGKVYTADWFRAQISNYEKLATQTPDSYETKMLPVLTRPEAWKHDPNSPTQTPIE